MKLRFKAACILLFILGSGLQLWGQSSLLTQPLSILQAVDQLELEKAALIAETQAELEKETEKIRRL